jgi:hypothetical protein
MSALIAPASVAIAKPFLLEDQFDAVGQLGVVRDEDWDSVIELLSEKNADYIIVQTDQGPFAIITKYNT